jgi:hypothetical protein
MFRHVDQLAFVGRNQVRHQNGKAAVDDKNIGFGSILFIAGCGFCGYLVQTPDGVEKVAKDVGENLGIDAQLPPSITSPIKNVFCGIQDLIPSTAKDALGIEPWNAKGVEAVVVEETPDPAA